MKWLHLIAQSCVALPFICTLLAGLYLAWKSRAVHVRAIGMMWRLFWTPAQAQADGVTIHPRAALLTAMSTTIGVGNVAGPLVAVGMGGPGALVCYVLASLVGGATMFSEVWLGVTHRRRRRDGRIAGGPMNYLRLVKPWLSPAYAVSCAGLLLGWSATNANTLALTLEQYHVSRAATGLAMSACVLLLVSGGIVRIAKLNDKLVPCMCALYCLGTGWIIFGVYGAHVPRALRLICHTFWHPGAVGYGLGVGTTVQVLRHGFARALQANEAGVGTSTIPHSMAHTQSSVEQASLAMASVYFNGLLCFLTGLTVVVTGPFAAGTVFDVTLLNRIFVAHFSHWGGYLLSMSICMFTFGTIIGNCFNGGHCVESLVGRRRQFGYYAACACAVLAGAVFDLHTVFACIDYLIIPVLVCNTSALVILAHQGRIDFSLRSAPDLRGPEDSALASAPVRRLRQERR